MKEKLTGSVKSLITCDLLNSVVSLFGETFLVANMLEISSQNISKVAAFYMIVYGLLGIGVYWLEHIIKARPKYKVAFYRSGMIIKAFYILLIVFLREKVISYFWLIAIFYAVSEAFYWSSHEIISIELNKNSTRKKYFAIKKILSKTIHVIIPFVLGTSIELISFSSLAIYIFIIAVIQTFVSFKIKSDIGENTESKSFDRKAFKASLNEEQSRVLHKIYGVSFLFGIVMDTIRTAVVILTMMTFQTSFNLGVFTSVFAIVSILSFIIYNRFYQPRHAKKTLLSISIISVLGLIGLLFDINPITLIIYNFAYSLTHGILDIMFKVKEGNLVNEYQLNKWTVEYYATAEGIFMSLGRVIGFSLLLFCGFFAQAWVFKILLLLLTCVIPIYAYLLYLLEVKKENSIDKY